jgi:hypothetical protein
MTKKEFMIQYVLNRSKGFEGRKTYTDNFAHEAETEWYRIQILTEEEIK